MICAICLEENANKRLQNCGHYFHETCINTWLNIKPICPLCRNICTNEYDYYFKNTFIKKGKIIIDNNVIILTKKYLLNRCKNIPFTIPLNRISRIDYTRYKIKITFTKKNRKKIRNIYMSNPIYLFNSCKFYLNKNI
jgi:hypothetical protein